MILTKHRFKAFGLILLVLVCIAVSVIWPHWRDDLRAEGYQTDIFVEPTGSCGGNTPCFISIQEGIDTAEIGTNVKVAKGAYYENIIVDVPKEITLQGGWNAAFTSRAEDPSLTVIDGDGNANALSVGGCTAATGDYALSVEGFTFMNSTSGISVSSCGNDMPVTIDIKNNIIADNSATNGGGIYGGSSNNGTMIINLINNIIAWNSSTENGGGIYISAETNGAATINLTNNTITENSADNGGGIYLFSIDGGVTTSVIKNTIVRDNNATTLGEDIYLAEVHSGAAPSTEASSSYSDIGDVHIADGTYNDLGNNINADPLFVDTASGDFHLTLGSPCIDQGTNEDAPSTDFEGDVRPFNGDGDAVAIVDIGADEYVGQIQFALTVSKSGNGSGTVTSSDGKINCGSDCSESYNPGTVVTLTAIPATGSIFASWSGCTPMPTNPKKCTVTISDNTTVTATFNGKFNISGTVKTSSGTAIAGVTMTLSGGASGITTTDAYGKYKFTGLPNGNYTITPNKTGYTFTPASKPVTISGANVTGQNFTGATSGGAYSISGKVTTSSGTGISGATMTLSGAATGTTATDSLGRYKFTGLINGSYMVTPSKIGYTFTPANRAVTISGANRTGQNFRGNP